MGKMNLLKANWTGKVGQTVGAKWKDKSTLRTFTKPANPDTQEQKTVRTGFGLMTSFVARFADQLRYDSALATRGMSVRNAIIKLNKEQISTGSFAKADLLISKGGLQKPSGVTATGTRSGVNFAWTAPTATNFTSDAEAIGVVVNEGEDIAIVGKAKVSTRALAVAATLPAGNYDTYLYFLDYRGNNKVGSASVYTAVTIE